MASAAVAASDRVLLVFAILVAYVAATTVGTAAAWVERFVALADYRGDLAGGQGLSKLGAR
jgi:hypothetical protein